MNTLFQSWFTQGKAVEALCGLGAYFVPDVTYRDEHDFVLAVGELLEWAQQGHKESATIAFEQATVSLFRSGHLNEGLRLLRSYAVLRSKPDDLLQFDEARLALVVGQTMHLDPRCLMDDERLQNLLLLVGQDFPLLAEAIGLKIRSGLSKASK